MEVFFIPGENELTHQLTLPQPPIHKHLLPNAMARNTFHALTNPAKINLNVSTGNNKEANSGNLSLVLSSGTNVKQTMDHCTIDCPLEMCTKLLEWSHLHPTSTNDGDLAEEIFTLTTLPHLFVIGGLSEFCTKKWKGVTLCGVSSFSSTSTVMVLNKDNRIVPMCFKVKMK